MSSTNLSFRTPSDLMQKFRDRDIKGVDNPGTIAKRDVERWYSLLEGSLEKVVVDPAEAVVMIHAASWWLRGMSGRNLNDLPGELKREIGLPVFYREPQRALAEKVERWPLDVRAALWDAAERYDIVVARQEGSTFGGVLHKIGLHSYDLDAEELSLVEGLVAEDSDTLPDAYMNAVMEWSRGRDD